MKNLRRKISLLFATWLIVGCAGKKTTTPHVPPLMEPNPSEQVSRPFPTDPIQLPPPADSSPIDPDVGIGTSPTGIIVVAGGVGVSSFGLIGVLKRLKAERIRVDGLVLTGWPSIPGLAYSFLKSIHDVEWMISRLTENDLESVSQFTTEKEILSQSRLCKILETNFQNKELGGSRTRVWLAAVNTDVGPSDTYDRGDWRFPLAKTMSIPGVYRASSRLNAQGVRAIDFLQGLSQGRRVVVLNFYEDFYRAVEAGVTKNLASPAMKQYVSELKQDFNEQAKEATVVGKVTLGKPFLDLTQRRLAIVLGEKEGVRIARLLKSQ